MGLDMYLTCDSPELVSKLEKKGALDHVIEPIRRYLTIAYWRKANAIHSWLVENVGCGTDDCRPVEVPVPKLLELKDICDDVLANSQTAQSDKCFGGASYSDGKLEKIYRAGILITNPEFAEEKLPTKEGFFFGSTDYDDYYLENLNYTSCLIGAIVEELSNEGEHFESDYHLKDNPDWVVSFTYQASW